MYCPRTELMTRDGGFDARGVMEHATIDRIAEIAEPGSIIRLHHYGESLLEPDLCVYAIEKFKERDIRVGINTNGSAATVKNVQRVFDAGLDEMVLSWHPKEQRKFADREVESTRNLQRLIDNLPKEYLQRIEMIRVVDEAERNQARREMLPWAEQGVRCSIKRKRNLGKVFGLVEEPVNTTCGYLTNNEFCVLYDGNIVSCCEVYDLADPQTGESWVVGNVFDSIPETNPGCSLCKGCPGYGNNDDETEKVAI